mmetsp:Transcript_11230/g.34394  ORF Transcript_11230/g.34394 Transcript_11230/m.34394 type:complete len:274 (-) Transcript_11230:75-896(-)
MSASERVKSRFCTNEVLRSDVALQQEADNFVTDRKVAMTEFCVDIATNIHVTSPACLSHEDGERIHSELLSLSFQYTDVLQRLGEIANATIHVEEQVYSGFVRFTPGCFHCMQHLLHLHDVGIEGHQQRVVRDGVRFVTLLEHEVPDVLHLRLHLSLPSKCSNHASVLSHIHLEAFPFECLAEGLQIPAVMCGVRDMCVDVVVSHLLVQRGACNERIALFLENFTHRVHASALAGTLSNTDKLQQLVAWRPCGGGHLCWPVLSIRSADPLRAA